MDDFTLTNLELRESTESGEAATGLSHVSMKGMVLLTVLELAPQGEPRGAVTVIHDAGDTGSRYKDLAATLAREGWAVALPDLRGHGQTEGERGHSAGLEEVWRDLEEVQNHLAYRMPDGPKVLVGQGLGALYALSYTLERGGPAALVLAAPLHEPRFQRPAPPRGLKRLLGGKLTPHSPGRIGCTGEQLTGDPELAASWAADPLTHDVITLGAIEQAQEAARTHLPRVAEAGVPVLVLHGDQDPLADVERSRSLAAEGVEVRVFEGLRHHPLQGPEASEARAALVGWLDAQFPRR